MDVHFTEQAHNQNPSIALEELFKDCNLAIDGLLGKGKSSLVDSHCAKLREGMARIKTDRWDGDSLRQFEILKARALLITGQSALNGEYTDEAVSIFRKADFNFSVNGVDDNDWIRVQNRYRLLHALAANGNSYADRKKVYHNFEALTGKERLNAFALKLFGRAYYFAVLVL